MSERSVVTAGVSRPGPCGVRDASLVLDRELEQRGYAVQRVWIEQPRRATWWAGLRSDLALLRETSEAAASGAPVLLHYSVFAFGAHGIPLLAPLLPLFLRHKSRVVVFAHEYVYQGPHRLGPLWHAVHSVAWWLVRRSAAAVVVTTEARRDAVPGRQAAFVPIWSTLPPPRSARGLVPHDPVRIGVFRWADASAETRAQVLGALVDLGRPVQLLLIGARPELARAGDWYVDASAFGLRDVVEHTGELDLVALADVLDGLDLYLSIDTEGVTSRRTTIAAALAHALPVVAIDGPDTWPALRAAEAVSFVPADTVALAAELRRLLDDNLARRALGSRAQAFSRAHLEPAQAAATVAALLES